MADATPTTTTATKESNVKVEMVEIDAVASQSLSVLDKVAHLLACIVAGVITLCVATVLADGTSVIKLKDPQYLPRATNMELISAGIDYRLDELLGPTYGVGLHHDQAGYGWATIGDHGETLGTLIQNLGVPAVSAAVPYVISTDDLKHPVAFLECDGLQRSGMAACGFGFIAIIVAVLMVIFHASALADLLPMKPTMTKIVSGLVWFTLSAGFLIVIILAIVIYTSNWECNQPVIPHLRLSDHFEYSYGFAFAILGFVCSMLIFLTQMICLGATPSSGKVAATKVVGGVFCGGLITTIITLFVLGGNHAYSFAGVNDAPTDPNVNPCHGQRPMHAGPGDNYFANVDCMRDGLVQTLEQAGANVTAGYRGLLASNGREPITVPYDQTDLCPVNVHWHLGAEHLSVNQFDEHGRGPADTSSSSSSSSSGSYSGRQLAEAGASIRRGFRCHHYDAADTRFADNYQWEHCVNMHVGETYEIHWPHSAAGACGTPYQYQSPFYDGVFCRDGIITITPLNTYTTVGVQSQVFTVIDDEAYYNPNLINGMIMNGDHGADIAKYTGSTTGTTRDNHMCSRYTPITWQVDRRCHLISASSFDKLCADMMRMRDDMSSDLYPHGARELVADHLVADNLQSRKK